MALVRRFHTVRSLLRTAGPRESSSFPVHNGNEFSWNQIGDDFRFGCWRSYHSSLCLVPNVHGKSGFSRLYEGHNASTHLLRSTMIAEFLPFTSNKRSATTQVKAPPQLQKTGAVRVSMVSPGFVYEPYTLREKISIWRRCFTKGDWQRTKEDFIKELRSAYAIAKLRKTGYSKNSFYIEALELYKEALKNEIKQREAIWDRVHWEMIEPVVKIRTLQARLIGIDRTDLKKAFIQLTLEFLTKQKFEAYDLKGNVVAGDKNKEVLVRDIWVFEKSLFHTGAYWRLCGRIKL